MKTPTSMQWEVYRLCHPDHQGMSVEDAAEEMGVTPRRVQAMLSAMRGHYPDLFADISGHKHCPGGLTCKNQHRYTNKPGIVRYNTNMDGHVRQKF